MKKFAVVILPFALMGCSVTPADLKKPGTGALEVLEVDGTNAIIYRRLVQGARHCFDKPGVTVTTDFFPDIDEGNIAVRISNELSQVTLATYQTVEGSSSEKTKINLRRHTPFGTSQGESGFLKRAKSWANGQTDICG